MKKNKLIIGILALMFLMIILYLTNNIGIPKKMIEKDARHNSRIDKSFNVITDKSKNLQALLFYNEDEDKYKYIFYTKKPGFSFGYFFRGAGSLINNDDYIEEVHLYGYDDSIFISSNKININKLEINDGNNRKVIDIDSKRPFILIIPRNIGIVNFFNTESEKATIIKYKF